MIDDINPGDELFLLDIIRKGARAFVLVEILSKISDWPKSLRGYFTIKPLEIYFDDLYGMEVEKEVVGIKFGTHLFHTSKSINKIKIPYKKQIIRKLFGAR